MITAEYQSEYFSHSMLLTGGYEEQESHTLKKRNSACERYRKIKAKRNQRT